MLFSQEQFASDERYIISKVKTKIMVVNTILSRPKTKRGRTYVFQIFIIISGFIPMLFSQEQFASDERYIISKVKTKIMV
jgi:hypothetical protein